MVTTNFDTVNTEELGLMDVKGNNQPPTRATPSLTPIILTSHENEPDHDQSKSFNYRQVTSSRTPVRRTPKNTQQHLSTRQNATRPSNPTKRHIVIFIYLLTRNIIQK